MGFRPKAEKGLRLQQIAREELSKLQSPLSKLTRNSHIPIRNMKDWVCRSPETRRHMSDLSGKIARPANSFLLYRSAYAARIIEWSSTDNYQVVSQLAGKSWKREAKDVKEEYKRLAEIEKAYHAKAHPGYKFAPRKRRTDQKRLKPNYSGASSPNATLNRNYAMCLTECDDKQDIRASVSLNSGELESPMMIYLDPRLKWETDETQLQHSQNLESLDIGNGWSCTEHPQCLKYYSSTTLTLLEPAYERMQPFGMQEMFKGSGMHTQLPNFYRDNPNPLVGQQICGNSEYPTWLEEPTGDSYMAINKTLSTLDSTPYCLDPYPTEELCETLSSELSNGTTSDGACNLGAELIWCGHLKSCPLSYELV